MVKWNFNSSQKKDSGKHVPGRKVLISLTYQYGLGLETLLAVSGSTALPPAQDGRSQQALEIDILPRSRYK